MAYALLLCSLAPAGTLAQDKEKKALFKRKRQKMEVSDYELNLRLSDFSFRFSSLVEATADQILEDTNDPEIREAALLWKIYGIAGMNKAIFKSDPVAAYFDAWPYTKQMVDYFDWGPGKAAFKSFATKALETSLELEAELDTIYLEVAPRPNQAEDEADVDQWVKSNPFTDPYFTRKSTLPIFAKWLGEERMGIGGSVVSITEQMSDLTNRINMYTDLLPKQIRWQMELAASELTEDITLDSTFNEMLNLTQTLLLLLDTIPELADNNRVASFREIDRQRILSLNKLVEERKAVIDALRTERIAVIEAVGKERQALMASVNDQTLIILDHIDSLSSTLMDRASAKTDEVINKVFWKIVILLVISFVGLLTLVLVYKRI